MKVVAAYLLALLGGKPSPGPDDIKAILGSIEAKADDDKLELFFKELGGKDVNEVLALGREKFAAGGGGGVAVASGGGGGGGGKDAPATTEEKKEEKKEEKEAESDEDMGFSLLN